MSKIIECKFECGTKLGDFDQGAHKYKEVDTGELHTQERCVAAKAKKAEDLKQTELSKQNEQKLKETIPVSDYVDHTLARPSKVKIIFGNHAPDVEQEYEEFQKDKKFAWSRAHSHVTRESDDTMLFTIFFWYEEK